MRILIILLIGVISANVSWCSGAKQALERFDIGFYSPVAMGVRNLAFELRIKNMTKMLNDAKYLGVIKDAYFKIFWFYGSSAELKTMGLPKGFVEKKKQLEMIARDKLEFVIPTSLIDRYKSYKLKSQISTKGILVRALKQDVAEGYDEIQLLFKKDGRLEKITTSGPGGTNAVTFEMSVKPWSRNKWVLDKMQVQILAGMQKSTVDYDFDYAVVDGVGLPVRIVTNAFYEMAKSSVRPQKIEDALVFSNYKINRGQAFK